MILDPMQTSTLNRLIAFRFRCNTSETKSLLNVVMCGNSAHSTNSALLHFDLNKVMHSSSMNFSIRGHHDVAVNGKLPSQVYHVFYSTSSDSIIYILAILCIYFLLFSLLIYANWNTFTSRQKKKRTLHKRRILQLARRRQATAMLDAVGSATTMHSIVCLPEARNKLSFSKNFDSKFRSDQEPKPGGATTTVLLEHPANLEQL